MRLPRGKAELCTKFFAKLSFKKADKKSKLHRLKLLLELGHQLGELDGALLLSLYDMSGSLVDKAGVVSLVFSFSSSALFFFSSFSMRAFSFSISTSSARGMDS